MIFCEYPDGRKRSIAPQIKLARSIELYISLRDPVPVFSFFSRKLIYYGITAIVQLHYGNFQGTTFEFSIISVNDSRGAGSATELLR